MKTTLVCVVNGEIYEKFAEDLFRSADQFFHPTEDVDCILLYGKSGWPDATMYRWHFLRDSMPDSEYVFLSDADMLFVDEVGPEILPQVGITATAHPGYVGKTPAEFPYERREISTACVYMGGDRYYCGGFVGGTREAVINLAGKISSQVDLDASSGIIPTWHDESCLNRCLLSAPPQKVLSPAFCYPQNSSWYETFWPEPYSPKLIALDKTQDQRGER